MSHLVTRRRPIVAASTQLCWALNESAAGPFANTGGAGALNMTLATSQSSLQVAGVYDSALWLDPAGGSSAGGCATANTSTGEVTDDITFSCWIRRGAVQTTGTQLLFGKNYTTTNTAPYQSLALMFTDNALIGRVSVSGANYNATMVAPYKLAAGPWYFVAATYDGSTIRLYLDGYEVATAAISGTVDFGGNGAWIIGGSPFASTNTFDGAIDECRLDNVVMTAATLRQVYLGGVGLIQ